MTDGAHPGLRERKKAKTRAAIQDAALRLYLLKGYAATTVQEIADAAEVSESTFFRYFPTKSETVLYDRLDPLFIESFLAQPAALSPIEALRRAFHDVLGRLATEEYELEQTRWRLVISVPELRAALMTRIEGASWMFADAVAKRVGRQPDDFAVLMFTGALIGSMMAAFLGARDDPSADLESYLDRGFSHFEEGLPL